MTANISAASGVLTVLLDRPEAKNAINVAMSDAVGAAMERADTDPQIHAVVIASAHEGIFCAGADLKATSRGEPSFAADGPFGSWGLAGSTARTPSVPVIAAVEGLALGGGFEICLSADLLVASPSASFGLPEVSVGLMAGAGGAVRLPDQLPRKVALDMLLTGRRLAAEEAHRLGLVSRLAEPGRALATAQEIAATIAGHAPLAVRATKATALNLIDGVERAQQERWQRNATEFEAVLVSADAAEGTAAFRDKRAPLWAGR
jgi:crotonobetainyl-CoA hydratase